MSKGVWLDELDEAVDKLNVLTDKCNRLREMIGTALQLIPCGYDYLPPAKKSRVIHDVKAILAELKEAVDE